MYIYLFTKTFHLEKNYIFVYYIIKMLYESLRLFIYETSSVDYDTIQNIHDLIKIT